MDIRTSYPLKLCVCPSTTVDGRFNHVGTTSALKAAPPLRKYLDPPLARSHVPIASMWKPFGTHLQLGQSPYSEQAQ